MQPTTKDSTKGMIMKREVPARVLHNVVQEHHKIKLKRLHLNLKMKFKMMHLMRFCHLTEMTMMMLDINQLTEGIEADRPI
jgi:hypothetical protein